MLPDNSRKSRIFVVDDDKENVKLILHILKKDYELDFAYDGAEAKEKLHDFQPDVLLSDITMPKMDGYELVTYIRSQDEFKNLKVLFISGLTEISDHIRGYEVGADDFIQKPFKTQELLAKVKVFVKLKRTEDELIALNKTLEEQIRIRSEQLIQSEKLAVLGRNTAGIIHNLNNPLGAILGISQLLKEKKPNDVMVDILTKATQKMQDIVAGILKSARSRNTARIKAININDLLALELKLCESGIFGHGVKIKTDFGKIEDIQGIESDFSQIFSNVIDNATQSMVNRPDRKLFISTGVVDNEVCVTIQDTGCGIPEENIDKIFDPFFTTKPSVSQNGEPTGTGLGMPTCRTMLESYGGKMTIESKENEGTIMRLYIPNAKK
jgi:signal transduction histidine kinase